MNNIKLTVFDMAGTTVNENNVVYKTVQKALANFDVELDLDVVLEFGAGKEKLQAIKDIIENAGLPVDFSVNADDVFQNFKQLLKSEYEELDVAAYEGVEELFELLVANKIKVVLNTGYDMRTAQTLLDKLGWEIGVQIDGLITADDVTNGRPSPDMIDKARKMFGIEDPGSVLKAGDSVIDIVEGKNANCGMTVGVLTGAHTRAQLESANPTLILDSLKELGPHLVSSSI